MTDTHGNRGKGLERAIRRLFASYESRGIHVQQNFPEQLHDGTLVRRHGFDFQIFYNGAFYAFDAKECAAKRWPLDKAKPHQLNALCIVRQNGGAAFFLVYFTGAKKLVKFDAYKVKLCMEKNIKSLSPADGEATSINLLGIK